jgi:hypothetical protein
MNSFTQKLLILSLFSLRIIHAQPGFVWAKQIGGAGDQLGTSIATDAFGNVITAGHFEGTVDFDSGPSTYTLNEYSGGNLFITKHDPSGNLMWAINFGGGSYYATPAVAVDNFQNIYVTGWFWGSADFDPDSTIFNLNSIGNRDIFVCKYNSLGILIWAKQMGSTNEDSGSSVSIDNFGNVISTGFFRGTADFDPGVGTYTLAGSGNQNTFISKLDSTGNFIWATSLVSTYSNFSEDIVADKSGNIYLLGGFEGTVDFDPSISTYTLSEAGSVDIFLCKFNSNGNFMWAKGIGGQGTDYGHSMAIDQECNIYATGVFTGTVDFNPGSGIYNLFGGGAYVAKFDSSGNFVMAKNFKQSAGGPVGLGIAVDSKKMIYTTGFFLGTADFDPGPGTYTITSAAYDVFVTVLDENGDFSCAGKIGGLSHEWGYSIANDAYGNIYTTGYFYSSAANFDSGISNYTLSSSGQGDVFVCKQNGCLLTTGKFGDSYPDDLYFDIYPNPTNGKITIQTTNEVAFNISVFDILGNCVINKASYNKLSAEIDLTEKPKGIYFIEVKNEKNYSRKKILKV